MGWSRVDSSPVVMVRTRIDPATNKQLFNARPLVGDSVEFRVDSHLVDTKHDYMVPPAASTHHWSDDLAVSNGIVAGRLGVDREAPMAKDASIACTSSRHEWRLAVTVTNWMGRPGNEAKSRVPFACSDCP